MHAGPCSVAAARANQPSYLDLRASTSRCTAGGVRTERPGLCGVRVAGSHPDASASLGSAREGR